MNFDRRAAEPNCICTCRDLYKSDSNSSIELGCEKAREKYGPINLPHAHAHLVVTLKERDQWLDCMAKAIDRMTYPASLKSYLIEQLTVPAERIRQVSTARAEGTNQLKD